MKVFVSSTYTDLRQHRRVLLDSLLALDAQIELLAMEYFGSDPASPAKLSRNRVREADVYLGVFGWRYGTVDRSTKMSITEIEYRAALTARVPSYIYLLSDEHAVIPGSVDIGMSARRIRQLRPEIQERHAVQFFTTPEDLGRRVAIDLSRHMRRAKPIPSLKERSADEPVDEHINPAHPYLFCHLATKSAIEGRYDVKMFIDAYEHDQRLYKALFTDIERVVYQLHPNFDVPVVAMQNWRQGFMIRPNVWGEFWARATLYFKKPHKSPVVLDRYINLPQPAVDEEFE